jgi:hypothetical protein
LLVDETNKIYLKGINETIIQTLGKLTIVLVIEGKEIKTEFHLVPRDFPILKNGILGDNFLSGNRSIINLADKTLIINTKSGDNERVNNETCEKVCNTIPIGSEPNYDSHKTIEINRSEIERGVETNNIKKIETGITEEESAITNEINDIDNYDEIDKNDNNIGNNNIGSEKDVCFTLKPRTETIVKIPIADSKLENKSILVQRQEIATDVYCGNTLGVVRDGELIVTMLNISEISKEVNKDTLNKLKYEEELEYRIYNIDTENKEDRANKIKNLIRSDHMNNEERQAIYELCEQYAEIFHLEGDILTYTNATEHEIKLAPDQTPVYKRPYRLPYAQQEEINKQIQQMMDNDIIEPSKSPWNSPLLLVRKKLDSSNIEKFRVVVDFRALNEVTVMEYHPLPNITEILDQLGQSQLFSVIDLASGFYQIKLTKESRECTAFSTLQGHWQFKRLVMGLKTSPATFQRLMNNVLAGIIGIKCLVYLDDIIIYGKNLSDHNKKLREVFE